MNKVTPSLKKGAAILLSFSIFFEAITPTWAMSGSSDEEDFSSESSPRILTSKQIRELTEKAIQGDPGANYKLGKHCYKEEKDQEKL